MIMEPLITALSALALEMFKETAKDESGSTLAKWLNQDVGKAAQQVLYQASGQYVRHYRERHGTLKVACVRMDTPIELDDIYTAVQLLDRWSRHDFESVEALQEGFRTSGRRGFGISHEPKQDGMMVANREPYLMVLGGPGIGKSTFLRKVGLEALKPKKTVGMDGYPLSNYDHPCIPVFLPLQRFKTTEVPLEQRISEEFATCGFPEPVAFTQAMLKKGRLLVLLDGLDEVPSDQEAAVIAQIQDFVDRYSQNRFIASCRVAAYKGGFPRFKEVAMAGFDEPQMQRFIRNWFRAEKDQEANTAHQCWELLSRPDYAAARELAQTPLLLTLLCAVYDKSQHFPKNRASLYGEALDVWLREWAAEKRIHNDPIYRDLPIELERALLAEIAYDSFVEDQLFFDKREVTRRIKQFLVSNLNAPTHLDSERVLEAIEIQQGILVERARDAYSFSHLTFQEYLTAQYIVDNQQWEEMVTHHLTDERWREVILLVAGLMRGRRADDLLQQMHQRANRLLQTPALTPLLAWADAATQGSASPYTPAAKRVVALYLALDLAFAHDLDRARALARTLTRVFAHDLVRAFALDLALDFARALARAFAHDLDRAVALALALDRALALETIKIFKSVDGTGLVAQLEALRSQQPGDTASDQEIRDYFHQIQQVWCAALQLDPAIVALSKDDGTALAHGLYAYELMVRCKEAAVWVSPGVWVAIEDRLLSPLLLEGSPEG